MESLEKTKQELESKVQFTDSVMEEKARLEQEKGAAESKIEQLTDEISLKEETFRKESEKATAFKREIEQNKEQLLAMEETTVSLTREN